LVRFRVRFKIGVKGWDLGVRFKDELKVGIYTMI
jgi:hypothetical protein